MKQQRPNERNRYSIRDHAVFVSKEQIEKAREDAVKKAQEQQQKNK